MGGHGVSWSGCPGFSSSLPLPPLPLQLPASLPHSPHYGPCPFSGCLPLGASPSLMQAPPAGAGGGREQTCPLGAVPSPPAAAGPAGAQKGAPGTAGVRLGTAEREPGPGPAPRPTPAAFPAPGTAPFPCVNNGARAFRPRVRPLGGPQGKARDGTALPVVGPGPGPDRLAAVPGRGAGRRPRSAAAAALWPGLLRPGLRAGWSRGCGPGPGRGCSSRRPRLPPPAAGAGWAEPPHAELPGGWLSGAGGRGDTSGSFCQHVAREGPNCRGQGHTAGCDAGPGRPELLGGG